MTRVRFCHTGQHDAPPDAFQFAARSCKDCLDDIPDACDACLVSKETCPSCRSKDLVFCSFCVKTHKPGYISDSYCRKDRQLRAMQPRPADVCHGPCSRSVDTTELYENTQVCKACVSTYSDASQGHCRDCLIMNNVSNVRSKRKICAACEAKGHTWCVKCFKSAPKALGNKLCAPCSQSNQKQNYVSKVTAAGKTPYEQKQRNELDNGHVQCPTCERVYDSIEVGFETHKSKSDGRTLYRNICKQCRTDARKQSNATKPMTPVPAEQTCSNSDCPNQNPQPIGCFGRREDNTKRETRCKTCILTKRRTFIGPKPRVLLHEKRVYDKTNDTSSKHDAAIMQSCRECPVGTLKPQTEFYQVSHILCKEHYHPNKLSGAAHAKRYREAHPEHNRDMLRARRTSHKACWQALQSHSRLKYGVEAHPDCEGLIASPCHYCGFLPEDGEPMNGIDRVDSSIPGYGDRPNLVTACKFCNMMKGPGSQAAFYHQVTAINHHRQLTDDDLTPNKNTSMARGKDTKVDKGDLSTAERLSLIQDQKCYLCGTSQDIGVDRVDSNLSYAHLDNCAPCCTYDNYMKRHVDLQTFLGQVRRIWKHSKLPEQPRESAPNLCRNMMSQHNMPKEILKQCKHCPDYVWHRESNMHGRLCIDHHNEERRDKRLALAKPMGRPKIGNRLRQCSECPSDRLYTKAQMHGLLCMHHNNEKKKRPTKVCIVCEELTLDFEPYYKQCRSCVTERGRLGACKSCVKPDHLHPIESMRGLYCLEHVNQKRII